MPTLIIELEGPMQSWGYRSRFSERDTGREPSKSGVIGILAASLGRSRDADLTDLAALKFGIRADREGVIKKEFQTALQVIKADGSTPGTQITNRYYLSGARFIAGFEGGREKLSELRNALLHPVFSQFLGRRSYVPSVPLAINGRECIFDYPLSDALCLYPVKNLQQYYDEKRLRIVRDAYEGEESATQDFRQDVPVSFARKEYLVRKVITHWLVIESEGAKNVHL
ncbi:MAG: type I-E CRISPR-associated protein Cas5/CasD [Ignavibacteriaceae bacterium]|nr:type I-E CRISPR-associated protein Cas5/CasD [Ignavibacteriaceae bacterium]